jgi:hypothetical protein
MPFSSPARTVSVGCLAAALIGARGEAAITPYLLTRYFELRAFSTLYGLTWTFDPGPPAGPALTALRTSLFLWQSTEDLPLATNHQLNTRSYEFFLIHSFCFAADISSAALRWLPNLIISGAPMDRRSLFKLAATSGLTLGHIEDYRRNSC